MFYFDGQKKLIQGMPHTFVSEFNAWRCDNNGRMITEAQVQEMEFMLSGSDDGYDDPGHYVYDKEDASGSLTAPSRPRAYKRDYKQILVELWGRGGTGGIGAAGDAAAGGGAGGYSYKLIDWSRTTQSGITLNYTISSGVAAFTLGTVGGDTVFSVQPGTNASTTTPGVGGTAAGGDLNVFGGSGGDPTATAGGIGGTPYRSYFPKNQGEYARNGGAGATETTVAGAGTFLGAGGGGGFSAEGFTSPAAGSAAHVRVTFI